MTVPYDKYYETENLFGKPYPELMVFFEQYPNKGKVLDLGCGQGRNAIPLARLGFIVTGIDNSKVGIEQMNQISLTENLNLTGEVANIYTFNKFDTFDIILLDSMFHFTKKDKEKEVEFIQKIFSKIRTESIVVFCVQDTGNKIKILNQTIANKVQGKRLADKKFQYIFEDKESDHKSVTNYRMIVIEK